MDFFTKAVDERAGPNRTLRQWPHPAGAGRGQREAGAGAGDRPGRPARLQCRALPSIRRRRDPLVRNLPGDRREFDRQAAGADDNMDLAARPALGAPDGGVRPPPPSSARRVLAGANGRAVDEMERLGAQGIENAHPAPFPDQRLQTVVQCPHSSSRSRHGTPRGLFGNGGWITAHSRSVRSRRDIVGASMGLNAKTLSASCPAPYRYKT